MAENSCTLESLKYTPGKCTLDVLDQLLLPLKTEYVNVKNVEDGWNVINSMQVRGAPAIAIVGCLSLAVEMSNRDWSAVSASDVIVYINDRLNYLVTSRPTAVNLKLAADHLKAMLEKLSQLSTVEIVKRTTLEIEAMLLKDVSDNRAIGSNGADVILIQSKSDKVTVLTHCNTGSLATAGYGTALGVVRSLHSRGTLELCYFGETRPYMQGSRLTGYELAIDGIPSTLICDSAVASLMKQKKIDAVVVGADRVAANGDTANKIGTYQIAVLAEYHHVPFYVAAPFTTIDFCTQDGSSIIIEERSAYEMTHFKSHRITHESVKCWNPAFDVTPANLITGIITERGVFKPNELSSSVGL